MWSFFSFDSIISIFPIVVASALFFRKIGAFRTQSKFAKLVNEYRPPAKCEWRGKTVYFVVNPFGGTGNGKFLYQTMIKPMCTKAGINTQCVYTTHAGHLTEIGRSLATTENKKYDAVVVVGGDGSYHELLCGVTEGLGVITGSATSDGIEPESKKKLTNLFNALPFSLVPAGSSNGLTTAIGFKSPFDATNKIISGSAKPFDLLAARFLPPKHPKGEPISIVYDPMAVSWACVSDIDYFAEGPLRFLGSMKNFLCPVAALLRNKSYQGSLSFLPAPKGGVSAAPEGTYTPLDQFSTLDEKRGGGWRKVTRTDFFCFTAMNVSHLASDAAFCPGARCDDGSFDLMLVFGNSVFTLARVFLGLEDGSHVTNENCFGVKASEFFLEPHDLTVNAIDLSGVLRPTAPIHGVSLPKMGRFIR